MEIETKVLDKLAAFAAKELSRYTLNAVKLEPDGEKSVFVATDGKTLAKVKPFGQNGETQQSGIPVLVSLAGIKATVKALGKRERVRFETTKANGSMAWSRADGGTNGSAETLEGTYPEYQAVIPEPSPPGKAVGWDAHYLKRICELAIAASDGGRDEPVAMRVSLSDSPATGPTRFDFRRPGLDGAEIVMVLMPITLDEK